MILFRQNELVSLSENNACGLIPIIEVKIELTIHLQRFASLLGRQCEVFKTKNTVRHKVFSFFRRYGF